VKNTLEIKMIDIGNIKNFLQQEKAFCETKYDTVYGMVENPTQFQRETAFYWSGRISAFEDLLRLIEAKND
jgi:hypothetical protein